MAGSVAKICLLLLWRTQVCSQSHIVTHNNLYLQFHGIWCSLLKSMGTYLHVCIAHKIMNAGTHTYTQIIEFFLKNICSWGSAQSNLLLLKVWKTLYERFSLMNLLLLFLHLIQYIRWKNWYPIWFSHQHWKSRLPNFGSGLLLTFSGTGIIL